MDQNVYIVMNHMMSQAVAKSFQWCIAVKTSCFCNLAAQKAHTTFSIFFL